MVHQSVVGECGAKIIKRSLQDCVPHRERKTPSVLGRRLFSDLFSISRDTIAGELAEELVNLGQLNPQSLGAHQLTVGRTSSGKKSRA